MDSRLHVLIFNCKKAPCIVPQATKILMILSFVVFAVAFSPILPSPAMADDASRPAIHYWHMWTDAKGVSHLAKCEIHDFMLQSISPPAAPQWLERLKAEGAEVVFSVLPGGWVGTWHENPKPQWIIPLSGRWFVQMMDGTRVEMGPGEVSFGEDQNTKPNSKGEIGHLSGAVGNEPAVLMIIQLKDPPTVDRACRFK
jgi:hypothetical protein